MARVSPVWTYSPSPAIFSVTTPVACATGPRRSQFPETMSRACGPRNVTEVITSPLIPGPTLLWTHTPKRRHPRVRRWITRPTNFWVIR